MIKENLKKVEDEIKKICQTSNISYPITPVIVTKYVDIDKIKKVIEAGHRELAENKVQVAEKKIIELKNEKVKWHFIGHLQRNKVKKAVYLFDCIQSADSLPLLKELNKACETLKKYPEIFIQLNIGEEEQKFGFTIDSFVKNEKEIFSFQNLNIIGMMVVIPYLTDERSISVMYKKATCFFQKMSLNHSKLSQLSMGMSHDFQIAIKEGATMVRIGQAIFNEN